MLILITLIYLPDLQTGSLPGHIPVHRHAYCAAQRSACLRATLDACSARALDSHTSFHALPSIDATLSDTQCSPAAAHDQWRLVSQ